MKEKNQHGYVSLSFLELLLRFAFSPKEISFILLCVSLELPGILLQKYIYSLIILVKLLDTDHGSNKI